jgi:hypothetical protein
MVDEIRLGVIMAVVVVAIPTFIIVNEFKSQPSGLHGLGLASAAAENDLYASERFANSNPEEALYMMYDAQAADELDRCFDSESDLCGATMELIVKSCLDSQYDLTVCHDPRIEQLLTKA